ncbi:hypothetical protein LINGRAHAP2_LOCUS31681 [Linum grandiflorum]
MVSTRLFIRTHGILLMEMSSRILKRVLTIGVIATEVQATNIIFLPEVEKWEAMTDL